MKNQSTLFLSLIAAAITIISCSKNDNPAPASLIGTWNAGIMTGTYGGQAIPANATDQLLGDPKCPTPAYYQFNKDGTFQYGFYDSTNTTTPCALTTIDGTYTVDSGNKNFTINATVNGTLKQITNPIISLTANQLKWEEKDDSGNDVIHIMNIKK